MATAFSQLPQCTRIWQNRIKRVDQQLVFVPQCTSTYDVQGEPPQHSAILCFPAVFLCRKIHSHTRTKSRLERDGEEPGLGLFRSLAVCSRSRVQICSIPAVPASNN